MAAFGNCVGDKHVAPGSVVKENDRILAHNASTLPGSSGSAVVVVNANRSDILFVGIRMLVFSLLF